MLAVLNVIGTWMTEEPVDRERCYLVYQIALSFCLRNPDEQIDFFTALTDMTYKIMTVIIYMRKECTCDYDFIYRLLFHLRNINSISSNRDVNESKYEKLLFKMFNCDERTYLCLTQNFETSHDPIVFDKMVMMCIKKGFSNLVAYEKMQRLLEWRCPIATNDTIFRWSYKRLVFNCVDHIDHGTIQLTPDDYHLVSSKVFDVIRVVTIIRSVHMTAVPNEILFHIFTFLTTREECQTSFER
jgi:hypothetical protein